MMYFGYESYKGGSASSIGICITEKSILIYTGFTYVGQKVIYKADPNKMYSIQVTFFRNMCFGICALFERTKSPNKK